MAAEHDDMDLSIDESDPDNLFHVPEARPSANKVAKNKSSEPSEASKQRAADSEFGNENSIEVALRQELENVRKINQVVEGVIKGLEKAQGNMETVSRTVNSTSTLLQTWTRILSQTEHNQRLILNPAWQGANQDLADLEDEAAQKQQEAQRRHIEEQHRREAAVRKAEEDERRRAEAVARGSRGSRGRGRVTGRGGATSGGTTATTGYVRVGGQRARGTPGSSSGSSRPVAGVGRGSRGRGTGFG